MQVLLAGLQMASCHHDHDSDVLGLPPAAAADLRSESLAGSGCAAAHWQPGGIGRLRLIMRLRPGRGLLAGVLSSATDDARLRLGVTSQSATGSTGPAMQFAGKSFQELLWKL